MKILLTVVIAIIIGFPSMAKSDTGLGISFGYPGVAATFRSNNFPVIGLAWYYGNKQYFAATIDYWIQRAPVARKLDWYWGIGATIGSRSENSKHYPENERLLLGARIPIGLLFMPSKEWEIFGELAPRIDILPGSGFNINGTIGIRYVW